MNEIATHDAGGNFVSLYNEGATSENIKVFFRDIENKLIKQIDTADAIFGCVAWLTNFRILDSLSRCNNVSIIVQKEDFLKPDLTHYKQGKWKDIIRKKYSALKCGVERCDFPKKTHVGDLNYCGDPTISPVRCVGNVNRANNPSHPRMHNKFVVFADVDYAETEDATANSGSNSNATILPYGVWTGSFNFSDCASRSFENALFITDPLIVAAYFEEYCNILALSEPLDWESEWISPEWHIGS